MSEDIMLGSNEAYSRVKRMVGQSNDGRIAYPSGSNMRGSEGRERHAEGDMVGNDEREKHARGDMVGKKKNCSVGDVHSAPGHGGSMMKSHFGEPQGGRERGTRRQAVAQAHGENHKMGDMVGREEHSFGSRVGRAASGASRMANQSGRAIQGAANKVPGMARQAGKAIQGAANQTGSAISKAAGQASRGAQSAAKSTQSAANQAGKSIQGAANKVPGMARQAGRGIQGGAKAFSGAMTRSMPRPMYRGGGRTEHHDDED